MLLCQYSDIRPKGEDLQYFRDETELSAYAGRGLARRSFGHLDRCETLLKRGRGWRAKRICAIQRLKVNGKDYGYRFSCVLIRTRQDAVHRTIAIILFAHIWYTMYDTISVHVLLCAMQDTVHHTIAIILFVQI